LWLACYPSLAPFQPNGQKGENMPTGPFQNPTEPVAISERIIGLALVKALLDPSYRRRLKADGNGELTALGLKIADGVMFHFVDGTAEEPIPQNSREVKAGKEVYLALPPANAQVPLSDQDLASAVAAGSSCSSTASTAYSASSTASSVSSASTNSC
jgi:hypothetical protein